MHVRPGQDQLGHVELLPQFRETRYARRRADATQLVGRGESAGESASDSAESGWVIVSGLSPQAWPIGCVAQKCVLWAASLGARAPLSVGRAC